MTRSRRRTKRNDALYFGGSRVLIGGRIRKIQSGKEQNMTGYYRKLRGRIREMGYTHSDMAKALDMSTGAFSQRMTRKHIWNIDECYKMLKLLNVSPAAIHQYFPPMENSKAAL